MNSPFRKAFIHPVLVIGSAVLWGIVEFIALQRARRESPRSRQIVWFADTQK